MNETTNDETTQSAPPKRATNRDVARIAGVSVATVSYVINNKEGQHISEATRKKVFQAMNLLNYMPNPHAVGLNTVQPKTIILRTAADASPLAEMEAFFFFRMISELCETEGYDILYSANKSAVQLAADACICYDFSKEEFHAFAQENYIPVLALESLIDDSLFYQVVTDYEKFFSACKAHFSGDNFSLVCIRPSNKELAEQIQSVFSSVVFVSTQSDITRLVANGKRCATSQFTLHKQFDALGIEHFYYSSHLKERNLRSIESITKALKRLIVEKPEHFITV